MSTLTWVHVGSLLQDENIASSALGRAHLQTRHMSELYANEEGHDAWEPPNTSCSWDDGEGMLG